MALVKSMTVALNLLSREGWGDRTRNGTRIEKKWQQGERGFGDTRAENFGVRAKEAGKTPWRFRDANHEVEAGREHVSRETNQASQAHRDRYVHRCGLCTRGRLGRGGGQMGKADDVSSGARQLQRHRRNGV